MWLVPGMLTYMASAALGKTPRVLSSVMPIHLLVSAVMKGVATPTLLIPAHVSPHHYRITPHAIRQIRRHTIIFWLGPGLETHLAKPLQNFGTGRRVQRLSHIKGILQVALRPHGIWETATHQKHTPNTHSTPPLPGKPRTNSHQHRGGNDLHLWLSLNNALLLTQSIAHTLAQAHPAHAMTYHANANAMKVRLRDLKVRLTTKLRPVKNTPYLVFHDAYQLFEKTFNLRAVGSISSPTTSTLLPRSLALLKAHIQTHNIRCLFSEPQFSSKSIRILMEGTSLKTAVLDPLGSTLNPQTGTYPQLMENLARTMVQCLTP